MHLSLKCIMQLKLLPFYADDLMFSVELFIWSDLFVVLSFWWHVGRRSVTGGVSPRTRADADMKVWKQGKKKTSCFRPSDENISDQRTFYLHKHLFHEGLFNRNSTFPGWLHTEVRRCLWFINMSSTFISLPQVTRTLTIKHHQTKEVKWNNTTFVLSLRPLR